MKKILIYLLFVSFVSFSQNSVKRQIRNSGSSSRFPSSKYLIIFDSTSVKMQESGLSYYNTHVLYKILTKEGAKSLNTMKFGYDPLSAFIKIKKVLVHRKNGETDTINLKKSVADYPAPARAIYWGAREKLLNIGKLEIGDAVEIISFKKGFTYALLQDDDDKFIPPMRGHFYDIIPFYSDNHIITKYYKLKTPKSKKLQYKFYNGEAKITKLKSKTHKIYIFVKHNIKSLPTEKQMVSKSNVFPKLLVSTAPDWESKSKWFYGVNEDFGSFKSTPDLQEKVEELLETAKTELDTISIITHWVADNMRYSGLSMGKGEGYTLHNAEMNFTDRCGVCKDKASLVVAMLRASGKESYPAMTMAGSRIDYIPADQFNHSIAVVKLNNGKFKILDPTWVPFVRELWSSREQQQNYLIGLPEGADLMKTPISKAENHYLRINTKSQILEDGRLKAKLIIDAEGQSDASFRSFFTRNLKIHWFNSIFIELMKINPQIEISKIDFGKNPYDYSSPMKIVIEFEIPNFAIVTDEEIIFVPFSASNIFKKQQRHLYTDTDIEERKYPFRDACSRLLTIKEEISLPTCKEAINIPATEESKGTGADFIGYYKHKENKINFYQKAKYKKRVYETEDWKSYKDAVLAQKKFAEEVVIISR